MPNHVINEVTVICGRERRAEVVRLIGTPERAVDFDVLLPTPLNYWRGSEGIRHEQTLKNMGMAWARENWGTKWNAYGEPKVELGDDCVRATFQTAWSPPHGWLVALFNKTGSTVVYSSLSEGGFHAICGTFAPPKSDDDLMGPQWSEQDASEAEHRRMHKLLWGVEEFDPA